MKRKKRAYILLGLVIAGVLAIPRQTPVRADEDLGLLEESLSSNKIDKPELLVNETNVENNSEDNNIAEETVEPEQPIENEPAISENKIIGSISDNGIVEQVSENRIIEQVSENGTIEPISENKTDTQSQQLLEESISFNAMDTEKSAEKLKVSENQSSEEKNKESLDVILPTEIPFNITLFGEEGFDALISSKQYCIENRGEHDVCIFIQGTCSGNDGEDYIMSASSVRENYVSGKKNAYIHLQWEDEERKPLEKPGITLGDCLEPGNGKIVLKAPKKDKNGEIIEENDDSKAYFSFTGDMKSDSDQIWKSEELKICLDFSVEAMEKSETKTEDNPNIAENIQKNANLINEVSDEMINEEIKGF